MAIKEDMTLDRFGRGICPVCDRSISLTKAGKVRVHWFGIVYSNLVAADKEFTIEEDETVAKPTDVIAEAIRDECRRSCGHVAPGFAEGWAKVAAAALTDERIVDNAVEALKADGWEETPEGPMGLYQMSDEDLGNIARVVLRSVGGA